MYWELVIAVCPALATAGLTSAGFWLSERRKDKNAAQQRLTVLSEENERLRYLNTWLKAYRLADGHALQSLAQSQQSVCQELTDSHTRLSRLLATAPASDKLSAASRAWRRAALIPLRGPAARVVRVAYWVVLLIGMLFCAVGLTTNYETVDGSDPGFGVTLMVVFIVFLPFLGVAYLLRKWARRLEIRYRRARSGRQAAESTRAHLESSNIHRAGLASRLPHPGRRGGSAV